MENKKLKLWVVIFLGTVLVAGGMALFVTQQPALFKGSVPGEQITIKVEAPAEANVEAYVKAGENGVNFGVFTIQSEDGDVELTSIILKKGTASTLSPTAIKNIGISVGSQTFSASSPSQDGSVTIELEQPHRLARGSSVTLSVRADIDASATPGRVFQFILDQSSIAASSLETGLDTLLSGVPANLRKITIAQPAIDISAPANANDALTVNQDESIIDLGKFILTPSSDTNLTQIELTKTGTTDIAAIERLELILGDIGSGSGFRASNTESEKAVFAISPPIQLSAGQSRNFQLSAGSLNRAAPGSTFNFSIPVDQAAIRTGNNSIFGPVPFNLRTITIAAASQSETPAISIIAPQNCVDPATCTAVSGIQNVVMKLNLAAAQTGLVNMRLKINDTVIPGIEQTIDDEFTYVWNTTQNTNGVYTLSAIADDIHSGLAVSAPEIKVKIANAAASAQSITVSGTNTDAVVAAGAQNIAMGAFRLTASGEDARITRITLKKTSASTLSNSAIKNIKLNFQNTSTDMSALAGDGSTSLQLPAPIPLLKGSIADFSVVANIDAQAAPAGTFQFVIDASSINAISSVTGENVPVSGVPFNLKKITIAGSPIQPATPSTHTLTVSRASTAPGSQTRAFSDGFFVAHALDFSATDTVVITDLTVHAREGVNNPLAPENIEVQLFESAAAGSENQLSAPATLDANGSKRFSFSNGAGGWVIGPPALTRKLIIKARIKTGAEGGKQFALGIKSAVDFSFAQGNLGETQFPYMGELVTVTQAAAVTTPPPPTVTVTTETEPADASAGGIQTCEAQGKYTYTGPERPGVRVPGMCIDCPTHFYIANGGTCDVQAVAVAPPQQAAETPQTIAPSESMRPSAYSPTLDQSQRLVSAPDRGNTGPGIAIYIGIMAAANGALWLRKKFKK